MAFQTVARTPDSQEKGPGRRSPLLHDPQTMKLLVIGVDGTEPSYAAIQAFLDQIGIPYDTFLSLNHLGNPSQYPLPVLSPGPGVANYYGIVLTSGNLAYCDPWRLPEYFQRCRLGSPRYLYGCFRSADGQLLHFPEARYGLAS